MPQPANDTFPNLASVPCGGNPEVHRLMTNAAPCRCGSHNLMPVSDAQMPPVFAVACEGCGAIEGDASNLAHAITNWNAWTSQ
jgi:hypothetical protein